MLLVFVLLGIHDWCVFEDLFNLVAANLPQGIKLSNLMLIPPQFGYQTCTGHLRLFPVVLSLLGTSK